MDRYHRRAPVNKTVTPLAGKDDRDADRPAMCLPAADKKQDRKSCMPMIMRRAEVGCLNICMAITNSVKIVGGAAALASSIGGGALFIEDRYENEAHAAVTVQQVVALEEDFQIHVLTEQIDQKQQRLWKYEDRLEEKPNDVESKERLRELKNEIQHLEKELEAVKKQ